MLDGTGGAAGVVGAVEGAGGTVGDVVGGWFAPRGEGMVAGGLVTGTGPAPTGACLVSDLPAKWTSSA